MDLEEKRKQALAFLGDRYLLHPANRVQKAPVANEVDVAKTIDQVKHRLEELV